MQMAFRYEEAVPWGRTFDEYRRMFSLTDADLSRRILGCADGPASFNAAMFQRGQRVISCDPLYQFTSEQIRARIDATYQTVIEQTRKNQDKFVWDAIKSPDELGQIRMGAMNDFLADYAQGTNDGRYVTAELPDLPFTPNSFDLALCSHFLFLYSDNFSLEFHQQSIESLCQTVREVRIFPLLTYNATPSSYVEPLIETLRAAGYIASIEQVNYEFQRGGNKMLRILNID
jgi:hypothetical protein